MFDYIRNNLFFNFFEQLPATVTTLPIMNCFYFVWLCNIIYYKFTSENIEKYNENVIKIVIYCLLL